MSAPEQDLATAIYITPDEHHPSDHFSELPVRLDVVPQFATTELQATQLARKLASPFLRYEFGIARLDEKQYGTRMLQRLGGSVLHHLHDETVRALDDLKMISFDAWEEGTTDIWYTGTWEVPPTNTTVSRILIAQEQPDKNGWRVVREYKFGKPDHNFRADPDSERVRKPLATKK